MSKRYSIGIDLGTSNSCVSICPLDGTPSLIDITQVLGPGMLGERPLLPSALYIPVEKEYPAEALALPWDPGAYRNGIVGGYARERGALAPDRLVSSAKSWLCNPHVDRYQPILPWRSELSDGKVSPVEASRRYLAHLRQALEAVLASRYDGAGIEDCAVVVTVPASFDEIARALTHEAATQAGLGNVTLLEEPQAAFYAWIGLPIAQAPWSAEIGPGGVVLVCDVGGGTADFSLIAVSESEAGLSRNLMLHRIAVGEHILLGGDNMDLALAYALKARLAAAGQAIDNWQLLALVHAARAAKERLLSDPDLAEVPIAVPSRGASLFAKTLATSLRRELALTTILDGYFPLTGVRDLPKPRKTGGLQELGLEYATEPALSRHLARFLARARDNVLSDPALVALIGADALPAELPIVRPTAVLFNGGVFHAGLLRERILALLRSWLTEGPPIKALPSAGLDTAVANGAAYYGAVQQTGRGIRIRAGTARSFYIGLESPMPTVPGYTPPVKAVCIVPQGTEEGTTLELPDREFGLVTGVPVSFRFFSSPVRAGDRVGSMVEAAELALDESSELTLTLSPAEGVDQPIVPVQLRPVVTAVGTLELWMSHTQSERKWRLEYNLRAHDQD